MKHLLLPLMLMSTPAFCTDYTNPIVDTTDTRKFPPVMITPADYQWPATTNDVANYKEPPARYRTFDACKWGMDLLGGCKAKPTPVAKSKKPVKKH